MRCEVAASESLLEILNIVGDYTSLCNISYLEQIAEHFKLKEASNLIKTYDESIETFRKEIPVKHACGQIFMAHFNKHLLKSQTVRFVLEWKADEKTLSDIQSVLRKAFHEHVSQVRINVVTRGSSIIVICYAPLHLHEVLTQLVKQNEEVLLEEDVISISIGGCVVLKRDMEKEVSVLSFVPDSYQNYLCMQITDAERK